MAFYTFRFAVIFCFIVCSATEGLQGTRGVLCALDKAGDASTASTCASDITGTIANQAAYDLKKKSHFQLYVDILHELTSHENKAVLRDFISGHTVTSVLYEKQIYEDGYVLRFLQAGFVCVRMENRTASGRVVRRVARSENEFVLDEVAIFLDSKGGAIPCGALVEAPVAPLGIFTSPKCRDASAHVAGCTLEFAECVDNWVPPRVGTSRTSLANASAIDLAFNRSTIPPSSARVSSSLIFVVKPTIIDRETKTSLSDQAGRSLHALRAHADFEARNVREAPLSLRQAVLLLFLPALLSIIVEFATIIDAYRNGVHRSSHALLTFVVLIVASLTVFGISIEFKKTTFKYAPIAVHGKTAETVELLGGRPISIDTYSVVVLESLEDGLAQSIIIASLLLDTLDIFVAVGVLAFLAFHWTRSKL